MGKDSPLAPKDVITPDDQAGVPIPVSGQTFMENEIAGWLGEKAERFHVAAAYNFSLTHRAWWRRGWGTRSVSKDCQYFFRESVLFPAPETVH